MTPFQVEGVYPALHVILQEAPPAKVPVQLPIPPLATEMLLGMEQDFTYSGESWVSDIAPDGIVLN